MNKANINRQLNCAIYTRKSTDERLDKEFNSLDAQRECAEAYIKSQTQEGWFCVPDRYDDGGFTGGNMDRPASGNCWRISRRNSSRWNASLKDGIL